MTRKTNLEWYSGESKEESDRRHAQWEKMDTETKIAIRNSFPDLDKLTGCALWHLLINREVYLPPQWTTDPNYDTGRTFRSWGALLAELIDGTDYLDYYCNNLASNELINTTRDKLLSDGWIMKDM